MIGRTISRYKVLEKLGEGGMGVVYKAEDARLKRMVALKFLPPHLVAEGELRERFEREAQAAAALHHPNVCTIFEIDEHEGTPFLVMEWVQGKTLAEKISDDGPLKIDEALTIAVQVARGLAEAHEAGIVHRDIKSANIMVAPPKTGREPQVKLMDFGLAHLAGAQAQLTREGTTLGTTAYMAPEQAQGEATDRRADIWAFGVVLYEMVAGRQPFRGDYEQAVIYSILNEAPEKLSAQRQEAPTQLDRIVARALEKTPEARYQSVEEMLADLDALRESLDTPKVVPASAPAKSRPAWLLPAAAVVAAVGLVLVWPRGSDQPAPAPVASHQPVPLTSYPGFEMDPTFSPDGNQVAFSWNGENQDNFDIYVKVVGSAGAPLRLTDHEAREDMPSWSPDGQRIAFHRHEAGPDSVMLVAPLGGSARRLVEVDSIDDSIAWGPASKTLYVSARDAPGEPTVISAVDVDSGERRAVTHPDSSQIRDGTPVVSATNQLAYSRRLFFGRNDLRVIDLSTGVETELMQVDRMIDSLAWVRGGDEILMGLNQVLGASNQIDRVRLSGLSRDLVVGIDYGRGSIALSPNGDRLAYPQHRIEVNLWRYDIGAETAPRKIASSSFFENSPQISPDGTRIVFGSARSGAPQIWMTDADGRNPEQITNFGGAPTGSPRWSPDGRRIVFDSTENGDWDIWIVDTEGGSPQPLAVAEGLDSRPSFSGDGRWVYFNSGRSGRDEIWKIPGEGGEAVPVTSNGGMDPFESQDESFVYYAKVVDKGLYRMPVNGGEETRVLTLPGSSGHWHPAEEGVYYLDFDPETSETLLKMLPDGVTEPRLIRRLEGPPSGPSHPVSVAPDGTWLVYAQQDTSESDLMLIEGFQ